MGFLNRRSGLGDTLGSIAYVERNTCLGHIPDDSKLEAATSQASSIGSWRPARYAQIRGGARRQRGNMPPAQRGDALRAQSRLETLGVSSRDGEQQGGISMSERSPLVIRQAEGRLFEALGGSV